MIVTKSMSKEHAFEPKINPFDLTLRTPCRPNRKSFKNKYPLK